MFFRKVTTCKFISSLCDICSADNKISRPDAGLSTLAYLTILILFMRQGERSRTPSGISRVSCFTFLAQATMDAVSFAGHITFAILAEGRPSISLIAPAFLACVVFLHEAVSIMPTNRKIFSNKIKLLASCRTHLPDSSS